MLPHGREATVDALFEPSEVRFGPDRPLSPVLSMDVEVIRHLLGDIDVPAAAHAFVERVEHIPRNTPFRLRLVELALGALVIPVSVDELQAVLEYRHGCGKADHETPCSGVGVTHRLETGVGGQQSEQSRPVAEIASEQGADFVALFRKVVVPVLRLELLRPDPPEGFGFPRQILDALGSRLQTCQIAPDLCFEMFPRHASQNRGK